MCSDEYIYFAFMANIIKCMFYLFTVNKSTLHDQVTHIAPFQVSNTDMNYLNLFIYLIN